MEVSTCTSQEEFMELTHLPYLVLAKILIFLDSNTLRRLRQVCSTLKCFIDQDQSCLAKLRVNVIPTLADDDVRLEEIVASNSTTPWTNWFVQFRTNKFRFFDVKEADVRRLNKVTAKMAAHWDLLRRLFKKYGPTMTKLTLTLWSHWPDEIDVQILLQILPLLGSVRHLRLELAWIFGPQLMDTFAHQLTQLPPNTLVNLEKLELSCDFNRVEELVCVPAFLVWAFQNCPKLVHVQIPFGRIHTPNPELDLVPSREPECEALIDFVAARRGASDSSRKPKLCLDFDSNDEHFYDVFRTAILGSPPIPHYPFPFTSESFLRLVAVSGQAGCQLLNVPIHWMPSKESARTVLDPRLLASLAHSVVSILALDNFGDSFDKIFIPTKCPINLSYWAGRPVDHNEEDFIEEELTVDIPPDLNVTTIEFEGHSTLGSQLCRQLFHVRRPSVTTLSITDLETRTLTHLWTAGQLGQTFPNLKNLKLCFTRSCVEEPPSLIDLTQGLGQLESLAFSFGNVRAADHMFLGPHLNDPSHFLQRMSNLVELKIRRGDCLGDRSFDRVFRHMRLRKFSVTNGYQVKGQMLVTFENGLSRLGADDSVFKKSIQTFEWAHGIPYDTTFEAMKEFFQFTTFPKLANSLIENDEDDDDEEN